MRGGSIPIYGLMIVALGLAPGVARAQDKVNGNPWRAITPQADYAVASPPAEPLANGQDNTEESADAELLPEEQEALRSILSNAPSVSADAPAKQLRTPTLKQIKKFDMSRTDK